MKYQSKESSYSQVCVYDMILMKLSYLHLLPRPDDIKRTTKSSIGSSDGEQSGTFFNHALPFASHYHLIALLHYLVKIKESVNRKKS